MSKDHGSKVRFILDTDEYNPKWEQKFKWLSASSKGKEYYHCKVCKRDNFGGLRQITIHSTTKLHMKAIAPSSDGESASLYFVESRPAENHRKTSVTPKKRRNSDQQSTLDTDFDETPGNPTTSIKTELIHLKTYTSPLDGKKIVLGMERRLEPIVKTKESRVRRHVVAPYSRTNETQAAVKTIEQAEAGLLIEEEAPQPVHPIVTVKSEPARSRSPTSPAPGRMSIIDSDAFDVFGKHVANKLRSLSSEQNKFAQKLVMDVLFEGEMETLDRNTKVVKCGVSCVCQQ